MTLAPLVRDALNCGTTYWQCCGLYYKHMTVVNDNSSVIIKWSFKLTDAARGIIYDCYMFIVQPTGDIFYDRKVFIIQSTGERNWQLVYTNFWIFLSQTVPIIKTYKQNIAVSFKYFVNFIVLLNWVLYLYI
jgi:hypothetical protein